VFKQGDFEVFNFTFVTSSTMFVEMEATSSVCFLCLYIIVSCEQIPNMQYLVYWFNELPVK